MRNAPGSARDKAKAEDQPPTAEEKKKLIAEKRVKDSVVEQALLKTSEDIGVSFVEYNKCKENVDKLIREVEQDLNHSVEVVSQVTQYHFSTQAEYELRMSRLRERIAGLEGQVKDAEQELADLKAEKKRVLAEKDSVIENQKREMKEMAYQFSDMLMKTLITITEDFESQSAQLNIDETSALPQRERLKEFNLDRIKL